ncbi:MAG: long-chain acyl-CoA synthetase [Chloroflexota bacterium]|nr:long-chain acyl-CoA synthetase [Chloroflexota bacterium]
MGKTSKANKEESDPGRGKRPWLANYDPGVPPKLDYPVLTINALLEQALARYPDAVFLRYRGGSWTYGQVGALLETLSQNLARLGLKKGQRVAVMLPNIPQFVLAYYAILKVGGIVVAINPHYKPAEVRFLLENSQPEAVICLDAHLDMLRELCKGTPVPLVITTAMDDWQAYASPPQGRDISLGQAEYKLNNLLFNRFAPEDLPLPVVEPDDPAVHQYSGGTTGTPKAAVGLQRNIAANVTQFRTWCGLREQAEVILAAIPLYHVYGMVLALNLGAALGAEIVLIDDPRDVDFVLEQIETHQVTFYPGVPSMYYAINQNASVQAGQHDLSSIKACISGSAPLHPSIKAEFERQTGGKLVEGYGLSEAPTATHCNPLRGVNKPGSIGLPLPDVDCRVVDLENGTREVTPGEAGELILRGPQVMRAYHNQPDETATALRDGWLYTGDVVRMDEEGYFFIVDRKKDLIKVSGFQVWPNEVEAVLITHPGVAECAAAGLPDMAQGERVVAWVVRKDPELSGEELIEWCRKDLAGYKVPAKVVFIDKLPRTGMGKVLKRELLII